MSRLALGRFQPVTDRSVLPAHIAAWLPAGAELVMTPKLTRLLAAAPLMLAQRRLVVIDGAPGTGKSTALAALSAASPVPVAHVVVTPGTNDKGFMAAIYAAITGDTRELSKVKYENALKYQLTTRTRILAIDEAQNASRPVLQSLRTIVEAPNTKFAVVLAGSGSIAHLQREEMLATWIGLPIHLPRLEDREHLTTTLAALHPGFRGASPVLLEQVHRVWARGSLRRWCVLLDWLVTLTPTGGSFGRREIEEALELCSGTPDLLAA